MSDLVGNPEDWFSCVVAQIFATYATSSLKQNLYQYASHRPQSIGVDLRLKNFLSCSTLLSMKFQLLINTEIA